MIYTSYFAKIKELKKNNIVPISICGKAPDWLNQNGIKCEEWRKQN